MSPRTQAVMKAVQNHEGGLRACVEAIQAYHEAVRADLAEENGELEVIELPDGTGPTVAEDQTPEEPSAA
jgi:hypothetical protein